nr:hypothetical protein [Tanacetum cinerariifolium]
MLVPTARRREMPLPEIALLSMSRRNCQLKMAVMLTLRFSVILVQAVHSSTKIQFRSIFVVSHFITLQRLLSVLISLEDPDLSFQQVVSELGKFEQWQFRMQQYLQHEHYALWEVIEFGDFYEVPANDPSTTTTNTTSGEAGTKSGRTVTLTTKDMQKKKNDVKARTTLLLSLSDEHQLRF